MPNFLKSGCFQSDTPVAGVNQRQWRLGGSWNRRGVGWLGLATLILISTFRLALLIYSSDTVWDVIFRKAFVGWYLFFTSHFFRIPVSGTIWLSTFFWIGQGPWRRIREITRGWKQSTQHCYREEFQKADPTRGCVKILLFAFQVPARLLLTIY